MGRKRKFVEDGDYEVSEPTAATSTSTALNQATKGTKASRSQPKPIQPTEKAKRTGKAINNTLVEEKRLARIRTHCPKAILERVDRVKTQRFYMIDREKIGSFTRERFKVLGSTGNVYTVTITNLPTCDCPDFLKGNHCKHILFVYLKVLNVKESSNLFYQKALLDSELLAIFTEAPAAPNSVANSRVLTAYANAVGKPGPSGSVADASEMRRNVDGEDCPVCYEEMKGKTASELDSIVFCDTCKNGLHADCFRMWSMRTPVTCVYCRAAWPTSGTSNDPTVSSDASILPEQSIMNDEDTMMTISEDREIGSKDEEDVSTVSISHLSHKLQHLASLDPFLLFSEVKRLAKLPSFNLKREIEAEPRAIINRLPPELLADIFLICQQLEGNDEYTAPTSQLVMASVCRSWRELALSTNLLWRTITISDYLTYEQSRLWLQRSGTALLRITMQWIEEESDLEGPRWTTESWHNVFQFLKPEIHRVKSFLLAVDDYAIMYEALKCLEIASAPELKRLELCHHDEKTDIFSEDGKYREHVRLFTGEDGIQPPPSLSYARMWGVHVDWSSSMFSNLQGLVLAYHSEDVLPSTVDFFGMLSMSAERLKELTIEASGPKGDSIEGWPPESITYPQLQTLKLAFLSPIQVQNGLLITDAPNLEKLHLDMDADSFDEDWNRIIEILCTGGYLSTTSPRFNNRKRGQPLFPKIRSLVISSLPVDSLQAMLLFYFHPGIEEVTMNFNYLDEEYIAALMSPMDFLSPATRIPKWVPQSTRDIIKRAKETDLPIILLPKLKVLRTYDLDGGDIRSFVEARINAGVPLRAVYFSDGSRVKRADRVWLEANLESFEEFEDTDDEEVEEEEVEETDAEDFVTDDDDEDGGNDETDSSE
ncbi:hypothetical protein FRC15_010059 [Serendipita sp. 397]|nr:hypothetical protein FRC15_010059 [Serendipita sp. 397]